MRRKEFKAGAGNAVVLDTLSYVHTHTNTHPIYFTYLREGNRRVFGRGDIIIHNIGYVPYVKNLTCKT